MEELYSPHVHRIKHQFNEFRNMKQDTSSNNSVIVIVDFSDNYSCNLANEPQTFHFGRSREQATLHTGVIYVGKKHAYFCTVSDNLRHDPSAIWAHLDPIIEMIKETLPYVNTVHFWRDGPTT